MDEILRVNMLDQRVGQGLNAVFLIFVCASDELPNVLWGGDAGVMVNCQTVRHFSRDLQW